jgi:excisionase family DNA binding protein
VALSRLGLRALVERRCREMGVTTPGEVRRVLDEIEAKASAERDRRQPMATREPAVEFVVLGTADAAAAIGISDRHVRRLVNDGELPGKRDGKRFRIPARIVDGRLVVDRKRCDV